VLDSFIGKDLKKYEDIHLFEKNPQYFKEYLPALNRAASEFFTVDGTPKKEKQKKMLQLMTQSKSKLKVINDLYKAWRVMR